jgi:hypothetical protein
MDSKLFRLNIGGDTDASYIPAVVKEIGPQMSKALDIAKQKIRLTPNQMSRVPDSERVRVRIYIGTSFRLLSMDRGEEDCWDARDELRKGRKSRALISLIRSMESGLALGGCCVLS